VGRFCAYCGAAVPADGSYCPGCGRAVAFGADPARSEQQEPPEPDGDGVRCPGCRQTVGEPGALCPGCGSKYPNPTLARYGWTVLAVGAAIFGLGYLGDFETLQGIGVLVGIVGGVMLAGGAGRAGPEQKQSCCGCTCAVALLALPVSYLLLWSRTDAVVALLALAAWPVVLRLPSLPVAKWLPRWHSPPGDEEV
jgi:RNA polymerase subunit RPABC4/transcription elongation factor Spt4